MSNTSKTQSSESEPSYGIEKAPPFDRKHEIVIAGEKRVPNTP